MLSLLVSTFGFVLFARSAPRNSALPLLVPVFALLFRGHETLLWILIGVFGLSLSFQRAFSQKIRRRKLLDSVPLRLERAVLSMIAGNSYRAALEQGGLSESELAESGIWPELARDLIEIERKPTKMVDQLRSLRDFWRTRQDFRRRSAQVLLQARTQAAVSAVFFVPLVLWNILDRSGSQVGTRLFVATILFATGMAWIFRMGRRIRWRV